MNPHRDLYNELYAPLGRTWSEFPPMNMPSIQPSPPRAAPKVKHNYAPPGRDQAVLSGVASAVYGLDTLPTVPVNPPGSDQSPSGCINPALLSGNPAGQDSQYLLDHAHNAQDTHPQTPVSTSKRQNDHPTQPAPERPLRRSQRPHTASPYARPTTKTRSHKPAMIPVEVFGALPKDQWKFFRTSQVVLDRVKPKPGGKQVRACQYIDPTTGIKCYQSKCHGMDDQPLTGRGFPINDLEDYIRHLWLHRRLERMEIGDSAPALLTSWEDEILDAQKVLDDANGIVYPYSP
ncbi:hypothetical protein FS749_000165 [Ceratobasidium sp. UAMH 11750]|nr:hypothetical protein FS749_000165 [Ceratobasidium sp. UAMH 11750]